jgi:exodeoxyribonuclease V gamma subunit
MALRVTFSNRFERLLESLLSKIGRASAHPLAPDRVIVPSVGVRRRIELAAADAHGVCANVEFSFLAQWLWKQIDAVIDVGETSPFAPSRLVWRVFRALGDPGYVAAHAPLARYVADADALMRYDLAQRIAGQIDHYITYRPEWLATWAEGSAIAVPRANPAAFEHEAWQAALWRRVVGELGTEHRHPSVAFFDAMRSGSVDPRGAGLPESAHVFCLPSIPPLYLQMLRELGRWCELELYVMNPCQEYWFDIVDPKRFAHLRAAGKAEHREIANALLAQWGKQTQAHIDLMLGELEDAVEEPSAYIASDRDTLLARVQNAILDLVPIAPGSLAPLAPDDRSIEIHVCHSMARELEVLHDQLLAMFAADPSLAPSDVLVVTPRLEEAAPLIEAVFETVPKARAIPYSITGRARSIVNAPARALLDAIAFATSRFTASAFMDLLQQPIVARRFGIEAARLESIRTWLRDAGVRWGLDAAHRAALSLPAMERYSFDDGLNRLYLGYALPACTRAPLAARLPAGDAEGTDALALGCLTRVMQELASLQRELAAPKSASGWFDVLSRAAESLLDPDDDELEDMRELEQTLRTLRDDMTAGAQSTLVPAAVVRTALQAMLDDPARGGVPGGAVTFASMTSLRAVPYRVVCAIGMNDGAFPSIDRPLEFDLIAAAPKPGDRQRRTEDRNVFLDGLLAARDRFYVSCTGHDIRDNAVLPPSVVVAELLDVIAPSIAIDSVSIAPARRRLVVEHPLQAFSARYFMRAGDERLLTYNREYCDALRARLTEPVEPTWDAASALKGDEDDEGESAVVEPALSFFEGKLPAPDAMWRVIPFDRLCRFFRQPCRYLLTERLGLRLAEPEEELEDSEPFVPGLEARSALASRLLPALLDGADPASLRAMACAGVEFPPGSFGERLLDAELDALSDFARRLRADTDAPLLSPASGAVLLDVDGETWRVEGGFGDLRASGRVRYRYDDVRAKDYLDGWLEHVLLNALAPEGTTLVTRWHSRDGCYVVPPLQDARAALTDLVRLYARGLIGPLHFFPKSAWAYVVGDGSLADAQKKWSRSFGPWPGEDQDPAYRLCLRGVADALNDDFVSCATRVFGPLRKAIRDPRLA